MICISNPFKTIRNNLEKLLFSQFTIGAKTEDFTPNEQEIIFSKLNLSSGKYLNAGFLIIDVKKWLNKKITKELTSTIINLKDKITYWDQDVFNSYFDGEYFELPISLNTNTELESNEPVKLQFSSSLLWENQTLEYKRNPQFQIEVLSRKL